MPNLIQMMIYENIQYVQNLEQMTEISGLIEWSMSEKMGIVSTVEQVKVNMKEIKDWRHMHINLSILHQKK